MSVEAEVPNGDERGPGRRRRNVTALTPTGRTVSIYGDPHPPPSASFACANPRCGRGGIGTDTGTGEGEGGDGGANAGRRSLVASLQCSGCDAARYCSAECRRDDWWGTGADGDDLSVDDDDDKRGDRGEGSDEAPDASGGRGAIDEGADDAANEANNQRDSQGGNASDGGENVDESGGPTGNRKDRNRRRLHPGGHGLLCRRIASLGRRCAAQAGDLRSIRLFPSMDDSSNDPVDCFDPDLGIMGHFDECDGSGVDGSCSVDLPYRYCGTRFDLMDMLLREGTRGGRYNRLALELALGHALDVLHLATADEYGFRYYVPSLSVALGRWGEAYDFVKYWLLTDNEGEDFDPEDDGGDGGDVDDSLPVAPYVRSTSGESKELPFLGLRDQDPFEPLEFSLGSAASVSLVADLTLIKLTIGEELVAARERVLRRLRSLEGRFRLDLSDLDRAVKLELRREASSDDDPTGGSGNLGSLLRCLDRGGGGRPALAVERGARTIDDLGRQCRDLLAILRAQNEALPFVMWSAGQGKDGSFDGDLWRIDRTPAPGTAADAVAICRRSRYAWVARQAVYGALLRSTPDHWGVPRVNMEPPDLRGHVDQLSFLSSSSPCGEPPPELKVAGMYPVFVGGPSTELETIYVDGRLVRAPECFQWMAWREFRHFPPPPSGPNLRVGTRGALDLPQKKSPQSPLSTTDIETIYRLHSLGCLLFTSARLRAKKSEADAGSDDFLTDVSDADDDDGGDPGLRAVLDAFRIDAVLRAKCRSFDDYATLVDRDPRDPCWRAVLVEGGRRSPSEYLALFPSRTSMLVRRVTLAQCLVRGHRARLLHRDEVVEAIDEYKRIMNLWRPVRSYLDRPSDSREASFSWASYRQRHLDMSSTLEHMDDEGDETSRLITDATLVAAREDVNRAVNEADEAAISEHEGGAHATQMPALTGATTLGDKDPMASSPDCDNIKLTHSVLKWFREADPKYRDMFCRRLRQLASGERSRILKKHLTGCKHAIWETYLDQASAQRIIWTECREKDSDKASILIWYVAKHKWVSRYINLIDKAEARLTGHVWRASSLLEAEHDETMVVDDDTVLIDPLGNVPLKLYQMPTSDVDKLTDDAWTPSLRLTSAEKAVVMTKGTVLLLGRSGTGKTVCVCNRMVYDLENRGEDPSFRQLFIARSPRICALVKMLVEQSFGPLQESITSFVMFEDLTRKCDITLRKLGIESTINGGMRRINFSAFKREFFPDCGKELDPLVAWTQIRSFIKGSIEAVQTGHLTRQAYMNLGTSRCRLKPDQREKAYTIYQSYEGWLMSKNCYDDCDAIADLLARFRQTTWEQRKGEELVLDNIYVDEVQDFTQAEIAFFWGLCDGGALFLAGDTAQSVVEGVSFRFDEVRSVAAALSGGDRQKIPQKPFILSINFRSHSGVLNTAAAVLNRMYSAFPGSANKIDPDEGLFKGPRPSFINNLTEESFRELLEKNPTMVLLTHDSNVTRIKKLLEDDKYHHIVLGIVEAKGLDFAEVMIVDFFSGLSSEYEKPWKDLLKTGAMFIQDHVGNPELEMQLKLLYTSITRARHRLFFVETKPSEAGGKFFRWLLKMKLVEKQNVNDMEVKLKTPEEWRTEGIEWACTAELEESEELAAEFFRQAILYFKLGGDESLANKARVCCNAQLLTKEMNEGEIEVSKVMEKVQVATFECLQEGLQEKAVDLCSLLIEMTDNKTTRRIFERNIFSMLSRGLPSRIAVS